MRFALIGRDVTRSLSPRLHAAALRETGRTGTYGLLQCPDEAAVINVIDELRAGLWDGLNVTAPWKPLARDLCEAVVPTRMRRKPLPPLSINTLAMRDGRLVGASTDGPGLTDVLFGAGVPLPGSRVVLLGAGGAAQAVAADLLEAGAKHLTVTSRRPQQTATLVDWLAAGFGSEAVAGAPWGQPDRHLKQATLVVHATSLGHLGQDPPTDATLAWLPWQAWRKSRSVLVDLVYVADAARPTWWQRLALAAGLPEDARLLEPPVETAKMHETRTNPRGVLLASGEAMLAAQAARSFWWWTGKLPDAQRMMQGLRG